MPKYETCKEQRKQVLSEFPPRLVTFFQDPVETITDPRSTVQQSKRSTTDMIKNSKVVKAIRKTKNPEFWIIVIALTATCALKIALFLNYQTIWK